MDWGIAISTSVSISNRGFSRFFHERLGFKFTGRQRIEYQTVGIA